MPTAEAKVFPSSRSLDRWAEALLDTIRPTAEGLGFSSCSARLSDDELEANSGASLSLVTEDLRVQLELLGQRAALEALARGLLMVGPDEPLDWRDAADAVNEILNIVAGALKTAVAPEVTGVKLGLPLFAEAIHHPKLARRVIAATMNGAPVSFTVCLGAS